MWRHDKSWFSSSVTLRHEISVLDQAPVSQGATSAQALRNAMALAQLADRLGFPVLVTEHHGSPSLACIRGVSTSVWGVPRVAIRGLGVAA